MKNQLCVQFCLCNVDGNRLNRKCDAHETWFEREIHSWGGGRALPATMPFEMECEQVEEEGQEAGRLAVAVPLSQSPVVEAVA